MSKATEKALDALHKALADTFKDILENGRTVVDKDTGEAMRVQPDASTLNAIRQFLRDNHVEVAPGKDDGRMAGLSHGSNLPFPTKTDEHGLPQ